MSAAQYTVDAEERRLEHIFTSETELALHRSTDCLRLAARLLDVYGIPEAALYLTEQADTNMQVLLPWVTR
jgi:hypothetical protein